VNYNPVDLNSLLYRMEADLSAIYTLLDQPQIAARWNQRSASRADTIRRLMWNEKSGLFFDYDFIRQRQSTYHFLTTFYPLWAGIATVQQAAAVASNLPLFEKKGGLQTSDNISGNQWDAPFGWAPLQIIAIEGLRRYGFDDDANRISYNFLATIAENFRRDGTIREKYNVVTRSSEAGVHAGYSQNVIGFGWTNAAFLVFLHELPKEMVDRLAKEQTGATSPSAR